MKNTLLFILCSVIAFQLSAQDLRTYQELSAHSKLESALKNPQQVRRLDLSGQNLTEIPASIRKLAALEVLELRNNQLTQLDHIESLKNLRVLDLGNNQLKTLPDGLESLSKLEYVGVKGNPIPPKELMAIQNAYGKQFAVDGKTNAWTQHESDAEKEEEAMRLRDETEANMQEEEVMEEIVEEEETVEVDEQLEVLEDSQPQSDDLSENPGTFYSIEKALEEPKNAFVLDLRGKVVKKLPEDFVQLKYLEVIQVDGKSLTATQLTQIRSYFPKVEIEQY